MDIEIILDILVKKIPMLAVALPLVGTVIVCAKEYIKASASKNDDAWLAKLEAKPVVAMILNALAKASLVRPKE